MMNKINEHNFLVAIKLLMPLTTFKVTNQAIFFLDNPSRSFFVRFSEKLLSRNEMKRYEIIHVKGKFRPIPPPTALPVEDVKPQLPIEEPDEPPVRHRRSTRHYGEM